tara:strand:- start:20652 stop:21143 length:492 start_codon:yes stop_codon:yes gene_type:complete
LYLKILPKNMGAETLILNPSKAKTIILLVVCTAFVTIGFLIEPQNSFIKWGIILFFGLCICVFALILLPRASYLKLTPEGFEVCSLYQKEFTKWSDIESFGLVNIHYTTMVSITYKSSHTKHKTGKKISQFLAKSDGALPDTYGLKPKKLMALLYEWKHKCEK